MNFSKKGTENKQKQIRSTSKKLAMKAGVSFFRTFLICMVILIIIGIFSGIGFLKGILDNAPSIDSINVAPTVFPSTIYDRKGNVIETLVGSDANRKYVELEEIPKTVQDAFIAIEDERFWKHNGIDPRGIVRAFFVGVTNGDFSQGASTLTQQLLKNQVFSGGMESNFSDRIERKLQEQYLAVQLEKKLSKEQILEYYLNTINLGQNTLGVQAASLRYFNKPINELTLSEITVIAGITKNPTGYNPITFPEHNAKRKELVLGNMLKQGYITLEQHDEALADDVYSRIQTVNEEIGTASPYTYFVDETINQVIKDLQEKLGYSFAHATDAVYRGGLSIYTTQDSKLQKISDSVLSNEKNFPSNSKWELVYRLSIQKKDGSTVNYSEGHLKNYFTGQNPNFTLLFNNQSDADKYISEFKHSVVKKSDTILGETVNYKIQPQISFVLMDQHNGQVKAIVGGRGAKEASRTLNRATTTKRQPGSTFKVVSTFLPALDMKGMTLASVQDDAEYYYPNTNTKVNNARRNVYGGLTTMRRAIEQSINVVTVKTLNDVTPLIAFSYLQKLGFTTIVESRTDTNGEVHSDINLPMALGGLTDGVTNLELTAAFAAIANNGVYTEPTFYTKILDYEGRVLLDNKPVNRQVMRESTSWLLTSAMEDVVNYGTGRRANFQQKNMAVAGKTGTTTNYNDLWFSGYTPYFTATIWSGYDNNGRQLNSEYHKDLWRIIMEKIHENRDSKDFKKPDSITTAKICTKSGKLAIDGVCDHALGGSSVRVEYFARGTVPTEKCDSHVKLTICSISKKPATEYCPAGAKKEVVYLVKEETSRTGDTPYILPKNLDKTVCNIHTHKQENETEELPEETPEKPGNEKPPENETEEPPVTPPPVTPPPEELPDPDPIEELPEDSVPSETAGIIPWNYQLWGMGGFDGLITRYFNKL